MRDYLHVLDLAKGHLLALDALAPGSRVFDDCADAARYKAYNLGRGRGMSVLQILEAMRKATGFDYKYEISGRRCVRPHTPFVAVLWAGGAAADWDCGTDAATCRTSLRTLRSRRRSWASRRSRTSRRCAATCGTGRRRTRRGTTRTKPQSPSRKSRGSCEREHEWEHECDDASANEGLCIVAVGSALRDRRRPPLLYIIYIQYYRYARPVWLTTNHPL